MKRPLFLTLALALALMLTASAFAGEGSDTVGDGKLLPQLRYSYTQTKLVTDLPILSSGEYNLTDHSIYAQLNWGVNPNLDVYGLVGGQIESLDADIADLNLGAPIGITANINGKYGYSGNFLYGLGMKATFFRSDNGFYVGGGLLFTHSFGDNKNLKLSGEVNGTDISPITDTWPTRIKTHMVTLTPDIHAGWRFKNGLTPYAGIEYRWIWALASYDIGQVTAGIVGGNIDLFLREKNGFGIFAGLDYAVNDRLYFNVEGKMLDRWGVDASVGYLFDTGANPRPAVNSPFMGGGGAGSDTIGDCRLLPQVRYSYMQTNLESDFPILSGGDYELTQHSIYAQLNWGISPNVDVYALAGAQIESLDADVISLSLGAPIVFDANINASYNNKANFLYGVGVKATFYRSDNGFYMGGGLLFTHSFGGEKTLRLDGDFNGAPIGPIADTWPTKISTRMISLTPDIHAGWHFKNGLSPYVGIEYRWAWADARYDIGQITGGIIGGDLDLFLHQKDSLGIFAGVDYYATDKLYFNVEGNALDRWGVSAGVGYLFDICEKPAAPAPAPAPVIEPKLEPMSKN
jgi:opacity protein-like surface antigen